MTQEEYNEAAALVVRLRKDLELHTDALVKSNAQCGEYLRHNEMLRAELDRISAERDTMQTKLHSELVEVRAALASVTEQRDSYKRTLDEWERADTKPHARIDPPVLLLCNVCHGCGMPLGASAKGPYLWCTNFSCNRKTTQYRDHDASPYWGPCKSATPVRHE